MVRDNAIFCDNTWFATGVC